jgi:undecaprenyl-diphosphatase
MLAGVAAVTTLGLALAALTDEVQEAGLLASADHLAMRWVEAHRSAALTTVLVGVTNLGSTPALIVVLAAVSGVLSVRRHSLRPVLLAIAVTGGEQTLVYLVKASVGRLRPDPAAWLVDAAGFSFPSGHAGNSLAGFAVLAWLVCLGVTNVRIRAAAWASAATLACAVGLSRIYLGVHYPSDVLAGWLVGGLWLGVVALATRLPRLSPSGPFAHRPGDTGHGTVLDRPDGDRAPAREPARPGSGRPSGAPGR